MEAPPARVFSIPAASLKAIGFVMLRNEGMCGSWNPSRSLVTSQGPSALCYERMA